MLKKALLIMILVLSLVQISYALGCCCDPNNNPSPNRVVPDASACTVNNIFKKLSFQEIMQDVGCDTKCGVPIQPGQPTQPVQQPIISQCSPTYTPPIKNLAITPTSGEKRLKLSFDVECPSFVNTITIKRCEGNKDDCSKNKNFQKIDTIKSSTQYIDEDSSLKFLKDYTYELTINYANTDSEAVIEEGNLGNLECYQQQPNAQFCLSERNYYKYENYLKQFGYENSDKSQFNDIKTGIINNFGSNFEKSAACNNKNQLSFANSISCQLGEVCQVQNNQPSCIKKSNCDINSGPLGLFASAEECEGTQQNPTTCYLEKTNTIKDKCLDCSNLINCFNYKSKGACEKNNCGIQNCEWHDVISELGIGVCVDNKNNNCENCDKSQNPLDYCTQEKANAFSTKDYACYYSKTSKKAFNCDQARCSDYDQIQCGSPQGGIILDSNNNILTKSTDTCGIGLCQYEPNADVCRKNSDGDQTPPWQDCNPKDTECEKDYFPPETELHQARTKTTSQLEIKIKDKKIKTQAPSTQTGKNYRTYVCILTPSNSCSDARVFTQITNNKLTINNLELFDEKTKISDLQEGLNTIKFYTKDPANNLETVKEYSFTACTNCQGAGIGSYSIKEANKFNNIFYTSKEKPLIIIDLLNEAKATTFQLKDGKGSLISISQPLQIPQKSFEFIPGTALSEGKYNFTFNAEKNNIFLDPSIEINFVVDKTKPTLKIKPEEESIINQSKTSIELNFSEEVNLTSTDLIEETYPDVITKKIETVNLLEKVDNKDRDGKEFKYSTDNKNDGKKTLRIKAKDYAGNEISQSTTFYVASKGGMLGLVSPAWGVAASENFALEIFTNVEAECGYLFDLPNLPVVDKSTFDSSLPLTPTGKHNHKANFNLIKTGDLRPHFIDFICKSNKEYFHQRAKIKIDNTNPEIITALARPKIIQETTTTTSNEYETTFIVELNEPGFCKYSEFSSDFNTMKDVFDKFYEVPQKVLETTAKVTTTGDHTFNIVCQNEAGLLSPKAQVNFKVDPLSKYYIESTTPKTFNNQKIMLRIFSSKKAQCFYGTKEDEIKYQFTQGKITNYHQAEVSILATTIGALKYFVNCQTPTGETAQTTIETFIDSTPPTITIDASTDYKTKNISWMNNAVKILIKSEDQESGVAEISYQIKNNNTGEIIVDWTTKTPVNNAFYADTPVMSDGTKYVVLAKAVNKAGLESQTVQSEPVIIDAKLKPPHCEDNVKDESETGIDCGPVCNKKCGGGQPCTQNDQCISNACENNTCKEPSCTDQILSEGYESDIGCGLSCPACEELKTCTKSTDCQSNTCLNGVCIQDLCSNGILDVQTGETNIDCGGSCNQCQSDDDNDGVLNKEDNCPQTPEKLPVTQYGVNAGCTEDQAYYLWEENKKIPANLRGKIKDADNDGLINFEEFKEKTDPMKKDTDEDGWNDGDEVKNKTSPIDPKDHPSNTLWNIIKWLLILAVLGGLGYGGYNYYKKYGLQIPSEWLEKIPFISKTPGKTPIPEFKRPVYIPSREEAFTKKAERPPRQKPEVFEKLKKFGKKPSTKRRIESETDVFQKLKNIKKK
ncbi:thrombospondin type 3 repeat-containing protein [Candidatus Woesearchaeota archaeon]|nr:thrombospondin type 3 repeat-containing protein [Candidatus Woesearchaeota archaeon]